MAKSLWNYSRYSFRFVDYKIIIYKLIIERCGRRTSRCWEHSRSAGLMYSNSSRMGKRSISPPHALRRLRRWQGTPSSQLAITSRTLLRRSLRRSKGITIPRFLTSNRCETGSARDWDEENSIDNRKSIFDKWVHSWFNLHLLWEMDKPYLII